MVGTSATYQFPKRNVENHASVVRNKRLKFAWGRDTFLLSSINVTVYFLEELSHPWQVFILTLGREREKFNVPNRHGLYLILSFLSGTPYVGDHLQEDSTWTVTNILIGWLFICSLRCARCSLCNRYGVARPPLHGYFKYGKKVITQKRSISHGSLNHHSIRVAELFQIHIKRILFDGFLEMLWRFQRRTWLTICPLPPFFT